MTERSTESVYLRQVYYLENALLEGETNKKLHELGLAQRKAGLVTESLQTFYRALQLDRFNYKTHIEVAKSLLLNADFAYCIETADAGIRFFEEQSLKSQLWFLYQIKGIALANIGDAQLALDPLFRAYELNPNFATKFSISQLQNPAEAQETLNDMLVFAPMHLRALLNLAHIYFNCEQYDNAFGCYSKASLAAQRSFYKSPEAYFGIAFLLQNEEPEAALQKYRQTGAQFGDIFNDGHAWANLAALFSKFGKLPAALTCARRAFYMTKDDRVRCILGYLYVQQGDYLRAFYTMSYFAGSDDPDAKWILGVAAMELNEVKIGFSQFLAAAEESFGAAACGLRYALLHNDIEAAKRFAALLRHNKPENANEKMQAKNLLKILKIRLSGGSAQDEENAVREQVEEAWEGDESADDEENK